MMMGAHVPMRAKRASLPPIMSNVIIDTRIIDSEKLKSSRRKKE